jgi:hypothetical protein
MPFADLRSGIFKLEAIMKITGYQLIDRIEVLREKAQAINSQFTGSLYRFAAPTEEKPDPRALMQDYFDCERKVALLQSTQAAYNVRVTVEVLGEKLQLQQAVKLIGSATRIKNNWMSATTGGQDGRHPSHYHDFVREKENEYAQRVVSMEECLRLSQQASDFVAALKQAIRAGNAVEMEFDIDPAVFS